MSVKKYVSETGRGSYRDFHVPDLVPPGTQHVKLLLILESPHVDELTAKAPVSGWAGFTALEYLLPAHPAESLGSYVRGKHYAGDFRIGILNVSNVPLQEQAFKTGGQKPTLSARDWKVIERVRMSAAKFVTGTQCAEANAAGDILLRGLQARVDALTLDADCVVVPCGRFAQRFTRELCRLPVTTPLEVLHPSRRQWLNHPNHPSLLALHELFTRHT